MKNLREFTVSLLLGVASLLACLTPTANAALIVSDFLTPGDGLLITDTSTDLQWLSPYYTRDEQWNDTTIQGIDSTYGFQYATYQEALDMINNNFNNPTVGYPGDAAGFTDAENFFNVFGINEEETCITGAVIESCPRTQGLTADSPSPGVHYAIGMIQFGDEGYLIAQNPWTDTAPDIQTGSFLVRSAGLEPSTPEPGTLATMLAGMGLLGLAQWKRSTTQIPQTQQSR